MLTAIQKTILYDQNAIYYGYPIEKLMEKAGEGIAKELIKKYGKGKRIGFFCGPGNNGGDGFAAARYLAEKADVEVFLVESKSKIRTFESRKNWELFNGKKLSKAKKSDISDDFDVIVDCLFGTGIKGKLREPYKDIVERMNELQCKKVTIDLPTPGFKADFAISMMFPKTPNAVAVDIGFPKEIKEKVGIGEIKILHKPDKQSHKGENGKLLIIGGSQKYHGAPLLAAKIASKIVDLVYFASIPENNILIQEMKSDLCEFIALNESEILEKMPEIDSVLIGPGLDNQENLGKFTNELLKKYPEKKFVLDADALKYLDKNLLNQNVLLTPHKAEFKNLFELEPIRENIVKIAKKYNCIVVLKGAEDYVVSKEEFKINKTGNSGMTKGGTGDVLAGLISALACKNDLFLAASAGVFVNGLAGDRLKKQVGDYFNASDLIREIPNTMKWCEDFRS